jgi:hypothetical protein
MPIDVNGTKATIKAALKTAFATEFGLSETAYDAFSGIIADAIGTALSHIKTDADVTGVTSGSDTVAGGVD